jgi:hypothetical protein
MTDLLELGVDAYLDLCHVDRTDPYDTPRGAVIHPGWFAPTNADLGFGPGSDDEQDELQWFLTSGRIIA